MPWRSSSIEGRVREAQDRNAEEERREEGNGIRSTFDEAFSLTVHRATVVVAEEPRGGERAPPAAADAEERRDGAPQGASETRGTSASSLVSRNLAPYLMWRSQLEDLRAQLRVHQNAGRLIISISIALGFGLS